VFDTLTPPRSEGCPSPLALGEYAASELAHDSHAQMAAHLSSCPRCREALRDLDDPSYLGSPQAKALRAELARRGGARPRGYAWLGAAAAAAAALLLFARSPGGEPDGARAKGADDSITVHVLHAGRVRRGGDGDEVMPGDALRFATTSARLCAFALYGYDARGRLDSYAQIDRLEPGREVALPSAVRLDDTPGEERFTAVFCDAPPDAHALTEAIRAGAGRLAGFPGCRVRSLVLHKAVAP
jgi:Putative zinc-finger